ncbi:MAG: winged helix DNA-binding domain-containing protein [Nitriliruptorales bacterium]|nr:winged helix DNA-binding domain-containing protein [Nitriliruptorales bacterium]
MQPTAALTWDQVLAFRQRRQRLADRMPAAQALQVVQCLGGLHAQVLTSAELMLWARVDGLERGWLDRALWEERTLVKTWAMRGTLHALPAGELALWCAALSTIKPRHHAASFQRYFGVSRDEYEQILAAIPEALDGAPLTRDELANEVGGRTSARLGDKLRESWGALLKPAAFRGLLCFAPSAGPKVRFTRPDRWLPGWAPPDAAEAAREATRRYLSAYGPATREQFARWFGTTPAHAGRLIAALDEEVITVAVTPFSSADAGADRSVRKRGSVDGAPAWMLGADVNSATALADTRGVEEAASAGGSAALADAVRLLPAFDQYVVAALREPGPILDAAQKARVYRPQGWISPVVLVDGRMAGVWRHEARGNRVEVEVEAFGPVPEGVTEQAEREAARLAAFLGGDLVVRWR